MFPVKDDSTNGTKFAGRSVARVIDNVDPKKKGRIRVAHPYLGDSVWIEYLRLPGQFTVPAIDELVYIESDAGWIEFPIAWGTLTKRDDETVPESFKRHNPSNRGIFSPEGHLFELDDGLFDGSENGIRLTTSGEKKLHFIETSLENKIIIVDENDNKIEINTQENSLNITTSGEVSINNENSSVIMSADGTITASGPTASLEMTSTGDITAENSSGSLVINAAGQVELKGANDGVVALIQEFAQELSTDTFQGFGAPAGKAAIYAQIATRAQALLAT